MLPALVLALGAALLAAEPPARIRVHGHRGARALRPENTLPAFEYAIRAGADVLELDVAVTRDNVVVVSHDPVLRAPVCTGAGGEAVIREHSLAELRRWDCGAVRNSQFPRQVPVPGTRIPTLDEVFALASRGTFEFNVETKSFPDRPELAPPPEEFTRLVLAVIGKHRLESRVILQSFDFRTLHAMKKLAPGIRRAALYSGAPRDFVAIAREAEAQIVSPHYSLVTVEQVEAAHRAGFEVVPWTVNEAAEWDRLIEARVDAIITDDPAALLAHLNGWRGRVTGEIRRPER
ncbi:MAG: glycerophosphodiester phosphodiesterase [Acidobacteria bacterium]|nr:glycerophosphodiester phosphodiesterase [Acidobacteriota bacterium]